MVKILNNPMNEDSSVRSVLRGGQRIRARNEARLINAAIQVFADRGLEGATTARIAETAGLPKANLYYYFASKETIYRRAVLGILEKWLDAFNALSPDDDPALAIADYVRAKMTASFNHPAESRLFARELLSGAPIVKHYLETELRDWVARKSVIIKAWSDKGLMAPVSPPHLFFIIWAATQTFADFSVQIDCVLGPEDRSSRQEIATDEIVSFVLRACGLGG
ncbi:transcriptional regulator, TetR family [Arboricoccus pini]|uniref:Transcriptional regulator, TetR family n=1 Tax=Arboricoccus pini TaxID=1963835 RepID=A0A212R7F1_9PROT|nr:TetR family transcriptional regulator C-terminal domain-containing protein [Arboricoccus pini]SNB68077.1 transcriptional regulator, TetR family [Arboricoccus pini]